MNLLLDTHAFLWLDSDPDKLSKRAREACADIANVLWLSVASAWEMEIKIGLGKLRLQRTLGEIIASQQEINGLRLLPVDLPHVLALNHLPTHHRDPFDRLLITQAKTLGWEIVSADELFKAYPVGVLW